MSGFWGFPTQPSFRRIAIAALTAICAAGILPTTSAFGQSPKEDNGEAAWEYFQRVVSAPPTVPLPSPVPSASPPEELPFSDGLMADISTLRDGVYRLRFILDGRAQTRTVRLPMSLDALITPQFKPNFAQVRISQGRVSGITLIESLRGQQEHQTRKIMINLSNEGARGAGECLAALYPSGGSFYALPVLVGQSCRDVVSNPGPPSYASAF